ncbi:hypothetical protein AB0953_23040 [Streptomyces sp. NPDC046866]|uniref:hypothetical protein n=1 Tax=Streptomyces sp. NPDC046866 TaxID=3154921 RepID=UPI0034567547
MYFEQVFTHAWQDDPSQPGVSVISVAYEPTAAGRRWLLLAALPHFSELVPFDDAAQAREFARAVLRLPVAAEPYEHELVLSDEETRSTPSGPRRQVCTAQLSVGRDPADGLRPYLAYQSYYGFPGDPAMTGLGLQVCCADADAARLRAEAGLLLRALDDEGPGRGTA